MLQRRDGDTVASTCKYREIRLDGNMLELWEDGITTPLKVKVDAGGYKIGCTYITFDAITELFRIVKAGNPFD